MDQHDRNSSAQRLTRRRRGIRGARGPGRDGGARRAGVLGSADTPAMMESGRRVRRLPDPNPVEVTEAEAEKIYGAVL